MNADDGITAVTDEEKSSMLNYYFSEYFMNDTEEVGDSSDLFCSTDEIMKLIYTWTRCK